MSSLLSGLADTLNNALLTAEQQRQRRTGDTAFIALKTILFELVVPSGATGLRQSYLFPLRVPPSAISLTEPFAADIVPTQRGGLYVEQSGVIQRRLSIRGNTGFWPVDPPGAQSVGSVPADKRSYSRQLPPPGQDPLSGLRHLQYLQEVFRTYGDLCRDPSTVDQVRLVYHDVALDEHFVCVPMSFGVEQSAASPVVPSYALDLVLVDKAEALVLAALDPDTSLLGALKNAYTAAQNFLARANQAVRSLTATQADLSRTVHGVGATLGQVSTLIGAAADFVGGTLEFIAAPFQSISAIGAACEEACRLAFNAERVGAALGSWPRDVQVRFRQITTACEQLAVSSGPFLRPSPRAASALSATPTSPSSAPPTSFAALRSLGSSAAQATGALPLATPARTSARSGGTVSHLVQQGESLSSLAAQYLGAASHWSDIAAANGYRMPLVPDAPAAPMASDGSFFGSVLRVGDTVLIPSETTPAVTDPSVPVVGAPPDASPAEQTLGTDLGTRLDARGLLDLSLGQTAGLPDLGAVSGLDNLRQAVAFRLATEQGTAVLVPNLGLEPAVGSVQAEADLQQVQLRLTQAVLADPRVAGVEDLQLTSSADATGVSMTLRLNQTAGQARLAVAV